MEDNKSLLIARAIVLLAQAIQNNSIVNIGIAKRNAAIKQAMDRDGNLLNVGEHYRNIEMYVFDDIEEDCNLYAVPGDSVEAIMEYLEKAA